MDFGTGHKESNMTNMLSGKKGLVIGIANDHSIALGCARAFHNKGAELAITYMNEKAEQYVRPLAEQIKASIILPLDVSDDTQMKAVFDEIKEKWGKLDFLLHAVAFAPKEDLRGRVVDCSREGFLMAMDVSCYSFIRLAHFAEPLMLNGGCLLTTSYYGSDHVIENYNMMGPVKSALEGAVKYLSVEMGKSRIRVNALSPGPIMTRAASGLTNFSELINEEQRKSPSHEIPTIDDVGAMAAFLVSDDGRHITGNITFIDCGIHVLG